jgi:hypothetical protein
MLFIVIRITKIFATAQTPEELIYKGNTFFVYLYLPDEFYKFDTVKINSSKYINRILNVNLFGDKKSCNSTACGNGYLASWKIVNNQLYLTGIYSCCYEEDSIKADLKFLFKERVVNGKVKADWVTQKDVRGGIGLFFWNDATPIFRKEYGFDFFNGKLMNIKIFDNSKSRKSSYNHNDRKLLNFIYKSIRWDKLPLQKEPIRVILRFSANEFGRIDEVEVTKGADEIFNKEAIRIIKSIPNWDIIYIKGQHYRQWFSIPIIFSEERKKNIKNKSRRTTSGFARWRAQLVRNFA